jgi:hypothetical protein
MGMERPGKRSISDVPVFMINLHPVPEMVTEWA